MKPEGTIRKTKDGYEAVFERRLHHPPERVWAMLTDVSNIRKWYVRTELEPRVGGRMVEHHDHVGMSAICRVTRYEPPRVFEHTWWEDEETRRVADSIRWEIFPEGTGSLVILRHRFRELTGAQGSMAGWHILLDILAEVLEGADPGAHAPPRGSFADGRFTQTQPGRGRWIMHERLEAEYKAYLERTAASLATRPVR